MRRVKAPATVLPPRRPVSGTGDGLFWISSNTGLRSIDGSGDAGPAVCETLSFGASYQFAVKVWVSDRFAAVRRRRVLNPEGWARHRAGRGKRSWHRSHRRRRRGEPVTGHRARRRGSKGLGIVSDETTKEAYGVHELNVKRFRSNRRIPCRYFMKHARSYCGCGRNRGAAASSLAGDGGPPARDRRGCSSPLSVRAPGETAPYPRRISEPWKRIWIRKTFFTRHLIRPVARSTFSGTSILCRSTTAW